MAELKEELERLTERIAAERRRIRSQAQRPAPRLQRGETGKFEIYWQRSAAPLPECVMAHARASTGDPIGVKGVHADQYASNHRRIGGQYIKRGSVVSLPDKRHVDTNI
jgi:hypothetical protein